MKDDFYFSWFLKGLGTRSEKKVMRSVWVGQSKTPVDESPVSKDRELHHHNCTCFTSYSIFDILLTIHSPATFNFNFSSTPGFLVQHWTFLLLMGVSHTTTLLMLHAIWTGLRHPAVSSRVLQGDLIAGGSPTEVKPCSKTPVSCSLPLPAAVHPACEHPHVGHQFRLDSAGVLLWSVPSTETSKTTSFIF